jgi:hypothetical protein
MCVRVVKRPSFNLGRMPFSTFDLPALVNGPARRKSKNPALKYLIFAGTNRLFEGFDRWTVVVQDS